MMKPYQGSKAQRKKQWEAELKARWDERIRLGVAKKPEAGFNRPPDRLDPIVEKIKEIMHNLHRASLRPSVRAFNAGYQGVIFDPTGTRRPEDMWIILDQETSTQHGKIMEAYICLLPCGTKASKELAEIWFQDEEAVRDGMTVHGRERDHVLSNIYMKVEMMISENNRR